MPEVRDTPTTGKRSALREPLASDRQRVMLVAGIGLATALYAWAIYVTTFEHSGSIGPDYGTTGTDWMVFYEAARSYFAGTLDRLFDGIAFTDYLNQLYRPILTGRLAFRPFLYPPHFLLLLLPFGLLSFRASYALFLALSFAALAAALAPWLKPRGPRRSALALLLISPAAVQVAIWGQNAFLTTALLVGGFGLPRRHPVLAGMVLGLLTVKPTLGIFVPIALVAARQWRAIASAAATTLLLAALSVLVLGIGVWQDWLAMVLHPPAQFTKYFHDYNRIWSVGPYGAAIAVNAPEWLADTIQAGATLCCAVATWVAFRSRLTDDLRLALLLALTLVGAPHASEYELVMPLVAALLLLAHDGFGGIASGPAYLGLAIWVTPMLHAPVADKVAVATPCAVAALAAYLLLRGRRGPMPAPARS